MIINFISKHIIQETKKAVVSSEDISGLEDANNRIFQLEEMNNMLQRRVEVGKGYYYLLYDLRLVPKHYFMFYDCSYTI